jgi:uncharacterized cupin superfamily protein
MKRALSGEFYCWSVFNEDRQIDFNGHLWVREGEGNLLIDPVPMIDSDLDQLDSLGTVSHIVITNRDHERQAVFFRDRTGAQIVAHEADAPLLESAPDRTVADADEIVSGLQAVHLQHGKSPGEIALYWPQKRLVLAGDLIVGAPLGELSILPDPKLENPAAAVLELRKLLALKFDAILLGDGHSLLSGAREHLLRCLESRGDIFINRIHVDEMEWAPRAAPDGYQWESKEIDFQIGARRLGYRLIRLPPGQATFPYHFHHVTEELFHIMEGECTVITGRGRHPVRAGDFLSFPAGSVSAHKFVNEGDQPCVMLALGNEDAHDVSEYPDTEKIGVKALPRRLNFRKQDAVDYWAGE